MASPDTPTLSGVIPPETPVASAAQLSTAPMQNSSAFSAASTTFRSPPNSTIASLQRLDLNSEAYWRERLAHWDDHAHHPRPRTVSSALYLHIYSHLMSAVSEEMRRAGLDVPDVSLPPTDAALSTLISSLEIALFTRRSASLETPAGVRERFRPTIKLSNALRRAKEHGSRALLYREIEDRERRVVGRQ